jgi:hypothetical protein
MPRPRDRQSATGLLPRMEARTRKDGQITYRFHPLLADGTRGKTGTIKHQVGPEAWDVMFTAKVAKPVTGWDMAEFQSFHVTELEVQEE